ncbi:MAG: QueT transporter family protein [Firmicutes bacterium]|nr:QueT transporter family protein [Bacillota bacterium]
MKRVNTSKLARGAVIAALYALVTTAPVLNTLGYGSIQFRVSEALNVLAFFEPAAIPGLFVGCIIANGIGVLQGVNPLGTPDVIFGSLLTLVSAYLVWKIKRPAVALLAPVLINAFGVALELKVILGVPYLASALYVGIGEAAVIYGLGYPLLVALLKNKALIREEVFIQKTGR